MLSQDPLVELTAAQKAARKAVESTYIGTCTVIEREDVKDDTTKITKRSEVVVLEEQPCKLSFEKITAAVQTGTAAGLSQGIKLFIAPEVRIKPGSKIAVTQNGVTTEYQASGEPAVYFSHSEYMLELFKERC